MQHKLQPFPYGAREGDVVLRLHILPDEDPAEHVAYLKSFHRLASFSEVWLDAPVLSGAHGRALALALRGAGWNTLATGIVEHQLWPTTPGRIVLDVSSLLSEPIGDLPRWQSEVSKAAARIPQVDEIFAVAPVAGALSTAVLVTLETLLAPGDGCTLYLTGEEEESAAIEACSRHGRPWAIRRAGPLQISGRAPGAAPAG